MKTLVTALVILILATAFSIFSAVYVKNETREVINTVQALPEYTDGNTDVFSTRSRISRTRWDEAKKFFRLVLARETTEKIDELYAELQSRYESGDSAGYASCREKLLSALDEIVKNERATPF